MVERIYKKVIIGKGENAQTWMAENLNYETENSWCGGGSGYVGKSEEYTEGDCSIYGRLYTWAAAKTACPDGWHLPSETEFEKLITNVDADLNGSYNTTNKAGTALKSTSGWDQDGNGTDAYGFTALPAGFRGPDGEFMGVGWTTNFWSATEDLLYDGYVVNMFLFKNNDHASLSSTDKFVGLSVRCVQDDPQ